VDADRLNDYIDAWLSHPLAGTVSGASALDELVSFMTPAIRYEDVPSGMVFVGYQGIKEMAAAAHAWSSDIRFKVLSRQTNGRLYAFETETFGTHTGSAGALPATGRPFVLRGVSVGRVSADSLIEEQRDYWDLGSFLVQVGVLPSPV
jgi:hypothetical protein